MVTDTVTRFDLINVYDTCYIDLFIFHGWRLANIIYRGE